MIPLVERDKIIRYIEMLTDVDILQRTCIIYNKCTFCKAESSGILSGLLEHAKFKDIGIPVITI